RGDLTKVGVTAFVDEDEPPIDVLEIPPEVERQQIDRLRLVRAGRDDGAARAALQRLTETARTDENLVLPLVDCARASCTEGEVVGALREVFGDYTETPRF
ncbi:MAG TPA: methylmalonyl-CoA mutase family protein, partial [Actinomycetota bacterium]|nr:methylmalonyl-CoA mutase family protein [Actinomycetota bacterium]